MTALSFCAVPLLTSCAIKLRSIKLVYVILCLSLPVANSKPKPLLLNQHSDKSVTASAPARLWIDDQSCSVPYSGRPVITDFNGNGKDSPLSSIIATFARCHTTEPLSTVQLQELGIRIRCYVNMSKTIAKFNTTFLSNNGEQLRDMLTKLRNLQVVAERVLFPFVRGKFDSVQQWSESYSRRGLVIASSSRFMRYTVFLMKNLRLLGCNLPVEVFYAGEEDLSHDHRQTLVDLGAKVIDLVKVMDNSQVHAERFAIKPFAMFASSFREAILLDADTVFLRNPELLFEDADYIRTGALFFPDQSGGKGYHRSWFHGNLPSPLSERLRSMPIYKSKVYDQMESSVVVMDKVRSLYGLLAACRINMKKERDAELYLQFFGDKETWWIGFEIAQADYAFSPFAPGAIGASPRHNATVICGKLAHRTRDDRPFWWNQGIVNEKFARDVHIPKYDVFTRNGIWIACMNGTNPIPLNHEELNLISRLIRLWNSTTGFVDW